MNSDSPAHNSFFIELLHWLEQSSLAAYIRQSSWLYPILEIIHIVGIVILVGGAIMFDFRLIGFSKQLPVSLLARHLLPWSFRALLFVIPSGVLLFITNAETLGYDITFWIKLTLIIIAGINAGIFHLFLFNTLKTKEESILLTPSIRVVALLSITLWLAIIACGRLLAY